MNYSPKTLLRLLTPIAACLASLHQANAGPVNLDAQTMATLPAEISSKLHIYGDDQDSQLYWYAAKTAQLKSNRNRTDFRLRLTMANYGPYAGQAAVSYTGSLDSNNNPELQTALQSYAQQQGIRFQPLGASAAFTTAAAAGLATNDQGQVKVNCTLENVSSNRGTEFQLPVCKAQTRSGEWINAEAGTQYVRAIPQGYSVDSDRIMLTGVTTSGWVEKIEEKLQDKSSWQDMMSFVTEWSVKNRSDRIEKLGSAQVDWRALLPYLFNYKGAGHVYSYDDIQGFMLSLVNYPVEETGVTVRNNTEASDEKLAQALTESLMRTLFTPLAPDSEAGIQYTLRTNFSKLQSPRVDSLYLFWQPGMAIAPTTVTTVNCMTGDLSWPASLSSC